MKDSFDVIWVSARAVQAHGAKPEGRLLVYCWRGGMRSGSMAWLFSLCGYQVGDVFYHINNT